MNTATHSKAILCLTASGKELALRVATDFGGDVFLPERLFNSITMIPTSENIKISAFSNWQQTFSDCFKQYQALICIMATGIVVRSLAELLQNKAVDPAVLVLDEKGQFVISLLAGHVGGANQLAVQVAQQLNATPVITTATDVQQRPALDMLAQKINAEIEPINASRLVNRMLAEQQQVIIDSELPLQQAVLDYWQQPRAEGSKNYEASERDRVLISLKELPTVCLAQLVPKILVVGIGCRKQAAAELIEDALLKLCSMYNLHRKSIKALASIDFKTEEVGIIKVAQQRGLPIIAISKAAINELEGEFIPSEWVKKSIGVSGVCEPAARIAANNGVTIIPKQIINGVTLSVAVEKLWWLDWDRETLIIEHLQQHKL